MTAKAAPAGSAASSTTTRTTATVSSRSSAPSVVTRRRTSRRRSRSFEEESGIDIKYTEDTDFTTTIKTRVAAGDTPDIGFFPQPGGSARARRPTATIQPIDTFLDYDAHRRHAGPRPPRLRPGSTAASTAPRCGSRTRASSGTRRRPGTRPATKLPRPSQELTDLAEQIKADGVTPWCMAWNVRPGDRLGRHRLDRAVRARRSNGPEVYDQWTSPRDPVRRPADRGGVRRVRQRSPRPRARCYGGVKSVVNTQVAESMVPAVHRTRPSACMERQGNFEIASCPRRSRQRPRQRGRCLPVPGSRGGATAPPILGGGDLAALFNGNDDEAIEVMEFLTSDEFGAEWAQAGGWLSPHTHLRREQLPRTRRPRTSPTGDQLGRSVFDGSDLMPKEVGSGTFWTGMVDWIQGKSSADTTADIEASGPRRRPRNEHPRPTTTSTSTTPPRRASPPPDQPAPPGPGEPDAEQRPCGRPQDR